MRTVELAEATGSLSEYARDVRHGPLVVTRRGRPVAAVVAITGMDLESLSLSTHPDFVALIERSRASYRKTGGISLADMRRKYGPPQTAAKRRSRRSR